MSRDESAPRIIPHERAAKVEHVRHVIESHRHPVDWRAIAGRLAGTLRGTAARTEAVQGALAEYDRATEGT